MRRSISQMQTLDNILEGRKSQFLFIPNLTPKKAKKNNLYVENLQSTAKAMKDFYNIKPTLKPQGSYRWENRNVKNSADYVELGNLTIKNSCVDKSRNKTCISLWDSLLDKTENEKPRCSKMVKSCSQDNIKFFLNPKLNISRDENVEYGGRKKVEFNNKYGSSGSISNLLNKTPEIQVRSNPYAKRRVQSINFLGPEWNNNPKVVLPNKRVDSIKNSTRKTSSFIPISAQRKSELYSKEIMSYNTKQKPREVYIHNTNRKLQTIDYNNNSNSQLLDLKLSRNGVNKSGTTISTTGYTRDTKILFNNKTIEYYK